MNRGSCQLARPALNRCTGLVRADPPTTGRIGGTSRHSARGGAGNDAGTSADSDADDGAAEDNAAEDNGAAADGDTTAGGGAVDGAVAAVRAHGHIAPHRP
jgi:hypothetical protein